MPHNKRPIKLSTQSYPEERYYVNLASLRSRKVDKPKKKKGSIVITDIDDQSKSIVRGSAPRAARIFVTTPANELMAWP